MLTENAIHQWLLEFKFIPLSMIFQDSFVKIMKVCTYCAECYHNASAKNT